MSKPVNDFPPFVLASRSARRSELLRQAGYRFRVVVPPLPEPEDLPGHTAPTQLAEALAYFKARAVELDHPEDIILAADTVVAVGPRILGKAENENQARDMLASLSGTRHEVITGLAVLLPGPTPDLPPGPHERFLASEVTCVTMRTLSDREIGRYVASGEWRDKAGAYAIQETADAFVEKVEGSFTNVVGLPMELLERIFRQVRQCLPARWP